MASIQISDAAIEVFRNRLPKNHIVRFGVKGGSCNGYSYIITFDDKPPKTNDITWLVDDVQFVVDKKSELYLSGSNVTWKKTFMKEGFEFENPNEISRCGCGFSFSM